MRLFDVRSGRPIVSDQADHRPGDKNYSQIAQPYWYDPIKQPAGSVPVVEFEHDDDEALA